MVCRISICGEYSGNICDYRDFLRFFLDNPVGEIKMRMEFWMNPESVSYGRLFGKCGCDVDRVDVVIGRYHSKNGSGIIEDDRSIEVKCSKDSAETWRKIIEDAGFSIRRESAR